MKAAIILGGDKLDHFDVPHLSNLYERLGFVEYSRLKWDDRYAPAGWDYDAWGRPDMVFRKLKTDSA